jgi:hypothetical protein
MQIIEQKTLVLMAKRANQNNAANMQQNELPAESLPLAQTQLEQ